jgi:hypothetical protein
VQQRNGDVGNRHGTWRVSLHYRQRMRVMFHRRRRGGNVCKCDRRYGVRTGRVIQRLDHCDFGQEADSLRE